MDRLMIVARLKPGKLSDAEALLAEGPPFEPADLGFQRHSVYLTSGEVVFLFEAPEVEWIVEGIVDDPVISAALGPWGALTEGPPRIAHERYFWAREFESQR
jgi:hypothetical protein